MKSSSTRRCIGTLAVIAAAVGTTLAGASSASATSPGADGAVVFTRDDQIWRIDKSGSGTIETQLTTTGSNRVARWSPSGTLISYGTRTGAIKTMQADGTTKRTILREGGYQPAWQPSGATMRIAYVVPGPNHRGDIYSIPATGGARTRLTTDGATHCGNSWPAFSANGKWMAYVQGVRTDGTCKGAQRLVIMDRATKAKKYLSRVRVEKIGETLDVIKTRLDFTADSTRVMLRLEDGTCDTVDAVVTAQTLAVEAMTNYFCFDSSYVIQQAPTPSGRWGWTAVGINWYSLVTPSVVASTEELTRWLDFDVQPLPAAERR